eukprot:238666_1
MATTNIPKQEYLHVLKTMNHCGQSNIIANYVEEANNYESNTALEDISEHDDVRGAKLHKIQNKVIQILNGILNDCSLFFLIHNFTSHLLLNSWHFLSTFWWVHASSLCAQISISKIYATRY